MALQVSSPGLIGTGSGLHSWVPPGTSDDTIAAMDAQEHPNANIVSKKLLDAKANNVRRAKAYQSEMAQQCFQNPPRRRSTEDFCWTSAEHPEEKVCEKPEEAAREKPDEAAGEPEGQWVPRQWEPPERVESDQNNEQASARAEEATDATPSSPAVVSAQQHAKAQVVSEYVRLKASGELSPTAAIVKAFQVSDSICVL